MKKINFGFNNDARLNGSFEGIEPYNGEFIDMIQCNDSNLLITRIVDSFNGLNGNIDVREVIQDMYAGGGYTSYSNQAKSSLCLKLEELLNMESFKGKLANGESVIALLNSAGFKTTKSRCFPVTNEFEDISGILTSIKPELFEELKQSRRTNQLSMFAMYKEIQRLHAELEKAKNTEEPNKQY